MNQYSSLRGRPGTTREETREPKAALAPALSVVGNSPTTTATATAPATSPERGKTLTPSQLHSQALAHKFHRAKERSRRAAAAEDADEDEEGEEDEEEEDSDESEDDDDGNDHRATPIR